MLKQKSLLEGRFQDIIKRINLDDAFGYKIIANKLISLMKDDNKPVKNLYDKYKEEELWFQENL